MRGGVVLILSPQGGRSGSKMQARWLTGHQRIICPKSRQEFFNESCKISEESPSGNPWCFHRLYPQMQIAVRYCDLFSLRDSGPTPRVQRDNAVSRLD